MDIKYFFFNKPKKLSLDEDNVQEFAMFKITNLAIFNFSYLGLYWKHGR